jgi:hypothetical protein
MKKITCLLFLLLFFVLTSMATYAQKADNFKPLAKGESGVEYFLNDVDVKHNGNYAEFFGLAILDKDNYLVTLFGADCQSRRYATLANKGVVKGTPVESLPAKGDKPVFRSAAKGSVIGLALDIICNKNLSAATGGRDAKE